jgi:hypothetical protein
MNLIEMLRQFRFLDYAVFDLALSFLGMAILSWWLSRFFQKIKIHIPKRSWVIWTLPIGIITHLLVGADTSLTTRFINPTDHYILKLVIILLTLIGFWGVKRVKTS